MQWAGRNNDMSKLAVQDVEDALFGASQLRDGNIEEVRRCDWAWCVLAERGERQLGWMAG